MTVVLNTQIETAEAPEAADGRFFVIPEPEQIDETAILAVAELDESFVAFRGMRRSRDAFRNILGSVPEERVHEAAQAIASVFEANIYGGFFNLARTNPYFMGRDETRPELNKNWLHMDRQDYTHAVFTPPGRTYMLDGLVQLAKIEDEAKLIDDTLTHVLHARLRRQREESEKQRKELEEWRKNLGLGKSSRKAEEPGWMKMEFPKVPTVTQGVLFSEAFRNFRTGEVTWSRGPRY